MTSSPLIFRDSNDYQEGPSVRLTRGLANLISDGQILGQGNNLGKKSLKEKTASN
jgi:hypothetical protein